MSRVEDQVRAALHELADDARPAALLQRLEATRGPAQATVNRRRLLGAVAVAVVVLVVAALSIRGPESRAVAPVDRPPKVVRLADESSLSPGPVSLAFTLAADGGHDSTPAYLLPRGADAAVRLPLTRGPDGQWTQHLSADGTHFVRQSWLRADSRIEIVDLRTGRTDDAGGATGKCATLSPDGALLAARDAGDPDGDSDAVLIDRRTGSTVRIGSDDSECGYSSFGWSPSGDRLVTKSGTDSEIRDRRGRLLRTTRGWTLVNGSMSWSPDGRDLLMYSARTGSFAILSAARGSTTALRAPTATAPARPVGWAGDRLVWLTGSAGDQRLVTTDRQGGDRRLWTRLDVGSERSVESISWSRDLTGA